MDVSGLRGHESRMRSSLTMMLALALGSLACVRSPERASVPQPSTSASMPEGVQGPEAAGEEPLSEPSREDNVAGDDNVAREDHVVGEPIGDEAASEPEVSADAEALASAFVERLTVWRRHDGTRVLTPHCRNGPVPCEERLRAFAALIVEVSQAHGVDPVLVGAMALKESGLDPSVLGRRREAGILQLHPRGAGHDIRYVRDRAYRARCQARVDACQREVLERALETLVRGMQECGGLRGGLGAYASGHCTTSLRYIDRVLEEQARLQQLVTQAQQR